MPEIRIENWAIVEDIDAYTAPEMVKKRLTGSVYGHPRFEDGKVVTTSSLKEVDMVTRSVLTKSGSKYLLGTPSAEYLALYPQAGS